MRISRSEVINGQPPINLYSSSNPLTRTLGKQAAETSGSHRVLSEKGLPPSLRSVGHECRVIVISGHPGGYGRRKPITRSGGHGQGSRRAKRGRKRPIRHRDAEAGRRRQRPPGRARHQRRGGRAQTAVTARTSTPKSPCSSPGSFASQNCFKRKVLLLHCLAAGEPYIAYGVTPP